MIASLVLDHCWVCAVRFRDSNPPGPSVREDHHIVPRAAGGANGPTVTLCETHHQILHKIALRMSSKKPHFDLVINESEERRRKLYWLATVVHNSFAATKNDPNKTVMAFITLDRKQQVMIEQLSKVYPQAKSREDVLCLALEAFYSRHFTKS
jgi:hypothetical protein